MSKKWNLRKDDRKSEVTNIKTALDKGFALKSYLWLNE